MESKFKQNDGICECCDKRLPKSTFYRHLKQHNNDSPEDVPYIWPASDDDPSSSYDDSSSSNDNSSSSNDDIHQIWKPSSTNSTKLLRYLDIKMKHNIND